MFKSIVTFSLVDWYIVTEFSEELAVTIIRVCRGL